MNSVKNLLRGNVRQYGMVIALVAIVVLFQITTDGILLRPLNVTNLFTQNASILILAIGMVIVIIARHIDLSVGSVAAFIGAVAAILMTKYDVPWVLAVILCLALGVAIGAWHGFWVAYVGIPAFIVTLSSMLLFRGLTLVVLKGATVGGLPDGFEAMGNGFLPDVGPDTGLSQPHAAHRRAALGLPGLPRVPQARVGDPLQLRRGAGRPVLRQARRDRGRGDDLRLPAGAVPRPADRRADPVRADRRLRLHHPAHGHRPARLRDRRQRRRGHHVRRQAPSGSTSW